MLVDTLAYVQDHGFFAKERCKGGRGGAVGWSIALQTGRLRVRFISIISGFFHWHNPVGRAMALGSTLTEMSARNISWGVNAAGA
jgi:hypothetical protein